MEINNVIMPPGTNPTRDIQSEEAGNFIGILSKLLSTLKGEISSDKLSLEDLEVPDDEREEDLEKNLKLRIVNF